MHVILLTWKKLKLSLQKYLQQQLSQKINDQLVRKKKKKIHAIFIT